MKDLKIFLFLIFFVFILSFTSNLISARLLYTVDASSNVTQINNKNEVKAAPVAVCGNNICETGEDYTNCPQDCPAPCIEDWVCTEWSECIEGKQTRTCTDRNNCGTVEKKPIEEQRCIPVASGIVIPTGLIVGIVVIAILAIGVLTWKVLKPAKR